MKPAQAVCWKCGSFFGEEFLPVGRQDECRNCHADLHVCKMCEFFALSVSKQCREPVADEVFNKEKANFCGYFQLNFQAHRADETCRASEARAQLEALFGNAPPENNTKPNDMRSAADLAREELEKLFGKLPK